MPLAGPRPNPNPANINPLSNPTHLGPQPFYPPSAAPSSEQSYPHQSASDSGSTALEPDRSVHPSGTGAQRIQQQWEDTRPPPPFYPADERDIALRRYDDEYEEDEVDWNRGAGQVRASSPSVGPWDSASQRSLPYHHPFPIPQPSHIPLAPLDEYQNVDPEEARHIRNKPSQATGLSYIDEEGQYYKSEAMRPASLHHDLEMRGLVPNAAGMGSTVGYEFEPNRVKFTEFDESPYPYPPSQTSSTHLQQQNKLHEHLLFPTGLDRILALFGVDAGKFPIEQAIERKKRGLGGQRWPVAAWTLAAGEVQRPILKLRD